jgi:hypothetical protein
MYNSGWSMLSIDGINSAILAERAREVLSMM